MPQQFKFKVICGATGSGKSRLLHHLANRGKQVLDLEKLALHKGSILGGHPDEEQPSQKAFDTNLVTTLSRFDTSYPVYVESESKKIGNLQIPEQLIQSIRQSPCISVELPQEERVQILFEDYSHFVTNVDSLLKNLARLTQLYGTKTIDKWTSLALQGRMKDLVGELLEKHYDPAYNNSIKRNFVQQDAAVKIFIKSASADSYDMAANQISILECSDNSSVF